MLAFMSHAHTFNPWGQLQPCWHCRWFAGMLFKGSAASCTLPNGPRVRAGPANGCSAWERVPGADDEPGPPSGAGYPGRCLATQVSGRPADQAELHSVL